MTIEVSADQVDACVAFYGLLGLERVDPPPTLAGKATWVERAGTQVHLMTVDEPVVPPKAHHALLVDDYDSTLDALRERGFDPDPRQEHWGAARAFVRNPAGHRVEIMAGSPARR